jgi:hypothetical protein
MARRFHRVRHYAGNAVSGWKGSAIAVASGAGAGLAAPYAMRVEFLQTNWWAMPAAFALVGHFLARKHPAVGGALMGVAGYWGYAAASNANAAPTATAKGFLDAGQLSYNDNVGTDAAPGLGTAQAAMLISGAQGFDQGDYAGDAGALQDAYGLET